MRDQKVWDQDHRDPIQFRDKNLGMGPLTTTLLGERMVVEKTMILNRRGRNWINIRIVGKHSLAWAEIGAQWGVNIQALVLENSNDLGLMFDHLPRFTFDKAS